MNDTDNGTYSDDNDVENDAQSDSNGGAMMSIFASYYGIEDDVKSRRPPGDLIDSAHFDSNAYVKVLYLILSDVICIGVDTVFYS